jgi:glutamine amidotransferase
VFAHNGDLKDYAPRLHGAFRPVGHTDSERAFCWLMQELAKSHASVPPIAELSATLAELLPQVARTASSTPCSTTARRSGRIARRSCTTSSASIPFSRASLQDDDVTVDFAEHTSPRDRVAVVVTEPLTKDEQWQAFAPGEMRVFVDGAPFAR